MGKRLKITIISLASILILGVLGVAYVHNIIVSKIENFLSNSLPENISMEYEDLDLSVLNGSFELTKPKLIIFGEATHNINLMNQMSSIFVDDISYWDYLFNKNIKIKKIRIDNPKITCRYNKLVDYKNYITPKVKGINKIIRLQSLNIFNGEVSIFDFESDSLLLSVDGLDVELKDISVDREIKRQKNPFTFSNYDLAFNNFYYQLNEFENLKVGKSKISVDSLNFSNLNLYTKYSKRNLSRIISVERDHLNLLIDDVIFYKEELGYKQDSIFFFKSSKVVLLNPKFTIYRDKLITEDVSIKSMYNSMLRNLNLELTLNEVFLKNATINYSERVNLESKAGEITFTNMNATIQNLGNTFLSSEKTNIDIAAIFMKSTPIKVNWYFDVNNLNDQFVFKAEVGRLPAQDMNPFSEPNLKVKFEGELVKTYFTIDGNFQGSSVDLRTNYDDFRVLILDKDGKEKNKLLSAIANLFIKKDTDKQLDGFREGTNTHVERDKTRSVFNFIWLNARAGLLSAMTGDGEK